MKLYMLPGQSEVSLKRLMQNKFTDEADSMEMRCSFCKEDRTNKEVLCTTSVSNSPVYLLISLMKFPQYNMSKIHSVVVPDQTLILQNGDHFELQGIADFHGEFISSGHYTASVQCSKGWVTCDDSIVTPTDNIQ